MEPLIIKIMTIQLKFTTVIAFAFAVLVMFLAYHTPAHAGISSVQSTQCTVSTFAQVAVGNQNSVTVLAANSRRAWARITLPTNAAGIATSTPFLSFNAGAAATLNDFKLSTSTPVVDFGLNADFPYTGAVTGITGLATTSVQVTQCVY